MKRRALFLPLLLDACAPAPSAAPLELQLPDRIREALPSTDGELCDQLRVAFTLRAAGGAAPPIFDDQILFKRQDAPCGWRIDPREKVPIGPYDLVARFETEAVQPDCDDTRVVAGAYVLLGEDFPFGDDFPGLDHEEFFFSGQADDYEKIAAPEGENEAAYRGEYADAVEKLGYDFDPDGDELDNLTELIQGSDPCIETETPTVAISASDGEEGGVVPITVVLDPRGSYPGAFGVQITIAHGNDLTEVGGIYETLEIQATVHGADPDDLDVTPAAGSVPRELWDLTLAADSDPLTWILNLTPEEPFVGELTVSAEVLDATGAPIPETEVVATPSPTVTEIPDPVRMRLRPRREGEDPSTAPPFTVGNTVSFPELIGGQNPDTPPVNNPRRLWDFVLENDDLPTRPEDFPANWTAEIGAGDASVHLTVADNGAYWTLAWLDAGGGGPEDDRVGPDNDTWLAQPSGGFDQELELWVPTQPTPLHVKTIEVTVSPPWNDLGVITPPNPGDLLLPSDGSWTHELHFGFHDPDRITGQQPTCVFNLAAYDCTSYPFESILCDVDPIGGGLTGEWTGTVTFVPRPSYADLCVGSPTFEGMVTVTDVAPAGAPNGAQTTGIPLSLTTADEAMRGGYFNGGPAAPVAPWSINNALGSAVVHGPSRLALVGLEVESDTVSYDYRVYLVDLAPPGPTLIHEFALDELCETHVEVFNREQGVAFEGDPDGEFLIYGRRSLTGPRCWDNDEGAIMFVDVDAGGGLQINSFSTYDLCSTSNPPRVVVDDAGVYWLACYNATELYRVEFNDGVMTYEREDLPETFYDISFHNLALATDGSGTPWLVWPTTTFDPGYWRLFLNLFDLNGFDGVPGGFTPTTLSVDAVAYPDVLDSRFDPHRQDYLFITRYEDPNNSANEGTRLFRLRFGGATPELESSHLYFTELVHQGSTASRLILREHAGEAPGEVDLLISPEDPENPVAYVDLDVPLGPASVVAVRDSTPFDFLGHRLAECPDRRYFISLREETPELFTWDPEAEPIPFAVGIPTQNSSDGREVAVSPSGHLIFITERSVLAEETLEVLYFPVSEAGMD